MACRITSTTQRALGLQLLPAILSHPRRFSDFPYCPFWILRRTPRPALIRNGRLPTASVHHTCFRRPHQLEPHCCMMRMGPVLASSTIRPHSTRNTRKGSRLYSRRQEEPRRYAAERLRLTAAARRTRETQDRRGLHCPGCIRRARQSALYAICKLSSTAHVCLETVGVYKNAGMFE